MTQYGMERSPFRLLLITPPITQLNTPYPATPYLCGFVKSQGYLTAQADLSLETVLALFSEQGLTRLFDAIGFSPGPKPLQVKRALSLKKAYVETIGPAIRFLQGKDPTLATQIAERRLLPEGPRLRRLEEDDWAFGRLGTTDRAKHVATLYLDDLTDLIQATIAPHFGLSRYAERLAGAARSFDPIKDQLDAPAGLFEQLIEEILLPRIDLERPDLVGITVPFPGNLYGALSVAKTLRRHRPGIPIVLGGGYINTELRTLSDPRLFDFVDYVTLDAGERPLLCLIEQLSGRRAPDRLRRTFLRKGGRVFWADGAGEEDIPFDQTGTPTYQGLPLDRYLSLFELLNPMHRLWSDGRWNKLTVAQGCYWKKCAFCDIGLDYIQRYDPAPARILADRIDSLIAETGQSGFHFVDEAAPPARLAELALELLSRGRQISWWGNIRFEEAFTADLCRLLAASGCIAVTGGLEVASDRLLRLMEKGITVAQAARVGANFARAGIMVHAYLMYGFPTETARETVESLERVRQLFAAGVIHSAFWHRFTATVHSPIGLNPSAYGIEIQGPPQGPFAHNDLHHFDPLGCNAERFGQGLNKALYNYLHGMGLEEDVRRWFNRPVPMPRVRSTEISEAIARAAVPDAARHLAHLIWIGGKPWRESNIAPLKEGRKPGLDRWIVPTQDREIRLRMSRPMSRWLISWLERAAPGQKSYPKIEEIREDFPERKGRAFERFLTGRLWCSLRETGLILL